MDFLIHETRQRRSHEMRRKYELQQGTEKQMTRHRRKVARGQSVPPGNRESDQ